MRNVVLKLFWIVLALVALAWLGASVAFMVKQEEWIHASPRERPVGPAASGLSGAELRIPAGSRGQTLAAWWLPAGEKAPAVLYLPGIGHNLRDEARSIAAIRDMDVSVLAVEYRGFGLSDAAHASEATLYEDADAAWKYLRALAPLAPRRSLYGHSIGGAAAIEVALRNTDVAALVLESTFTRMSEVILQSRLMRLLPLSFVLDQKYESADKIGRLGIPKLFIHGGADEFVPPRMADDLYARAAGPKAIVKVPGAGHSDALTSGAEARARTREVLNP